MLATLKAYGLSFWLWGVLTLVLLAIAALQGIRLASLSDGAKEEAFAAGQRIVFDLVSGERFPPLEGDAVVDPAHENLPASLEESETGAAPMEDAKESEVTHDDASLVSSEDHASEQKQAPAAMDEAAHTPKDASAPAAHSAATHHSAPVSATAGAMPAWEEHGRPFWNPDNKPMVAVIVSGLGLSEYTTQLAFTLPGDVTLSFSPYAHDVGEWMNKARQLGHEVLFNMPMEPDNYPVSDPGPHAILSGHTPEKIVKELDWLAERGHGFVGVLTPGNERLTQKEAMSLHILEALKARQWLTVIGQGEDTLVIQDAQNQVGAPMLLATSRIDETITGEAIAERLQEIADRAATRGIAIAVAHPYPVTIEAIRQWSKVLEERGILLAPVTALMEAGDE